MYSTGYSNMSLRIARQQIDEQIRDTEARRIAREARRNRSASGTRSARPRRRLRVRVRAQA